MSDKAIIEDHKKMVILSGKISNFQLENLTKYPFIVLEDIEKVTIDYDFKRPGTNPDEPLKMEDTYAGEVIYNFSFKKEPKYPKKELKYRLDQLESWVKYLFWTDTKVTLRKDGKEWVI